MFKILNSHGNIIVEGRDDSFKSFVERHKIQLHGANLSDTDLSKTDLSDAYLSRANFNRADLTEVNFNSAFLAMSNLSHTNLIGANFHNANTYRINLYNADITNIKGFWGSHDIIAQILLIGAENSVSRRSIAGLVLVSHDWCWDRFLKCRHKESKWALDTLASFANPDDEYVPDIIRKRM